jgi:hypothetical protein
MARKEITVTEYYDDIDGKPAQEGELSTFEFSFQGANYRIDLRDANAAKFEKALSPYLAAAARVSGGRGRPKSTGVKRTATGSGRSKEQLQAIRDWAVKEGYEVAPRGRIKGEIIEAFDAAH